MLRKTFVITSYVNGVRGDLRQNREILKRLLQRKMLGAGGEKQMYKATERTDH